MPIPKPNQDESHKDFMSRCMSNEGMNKEYPENGQRYAICMNQTKASLLEKTCEILSIGMDNDYEELNLNNIIIPDENDYEDCDELSEECYLDDIFASYKYKDPVTQEIHTFDQKSIYKKNGKTLIYMGQAAKNENKKVKLNKPFRTPGGPKKFSVYVKNDKGNVVKVNFGDPNMEIKRDDPERRKSYRARHNCDNPGPKWKANYWSCKMWSKTNVSDLT